MPLWKWVKETQLKVGYTTGEKPWCVICCLCHMAHNAACKGGDSFSGASWFNVEDLVVNLLLVWQIYKVLETCIHALA